MIDYKNENGITFIVLVTTIVVLLIIAAVSVNLGLEGVDNTSDKQDMSTLHMVQQVVLEQYAMATSLNVAEKSDESLVSKLYYGTKINNIDEINIEQLATAGIISPFPTKEEYQNTLSSANVKNEDYYYRLKTDDLKKLKIVSPGDLEEEVTTEETIDTYIVNYRTGEVYNETKQLTKSNNKILYVKSKTVEKEKTEDNTSFVD